MQEVVGSLLHSCKCEDANARMISFSFHLARGTALDRLTVTGMCKVSFCDFALTDDAPKPLQLHRECHTTV